MSLADKKLNIWQQTVVPSEDTKEVLTATRAVAVVMTGEVDRLRALMDQHDASRRAAIEAAAAADALFRQQMDAVLRSLAAERAALAQCQADLADSEAARRREAEDNAALRAQLAALQKAKDDADAANAAIIADLRRRLVRQA